MKKINEQNDNFSHILLNIATSECTDPGYDLCQALSRRFNAPGTALYKSDGNATLLVGLYNIPADALPAKIPLNSAPASIQPEGSSSYTIIRDPSTRLLIILHECAKPRAGLKKEIIGIMPAIAAILRMKASERSSAIDLERFKAAFDTSPTCTIITDIGGYVLEWNDVAGKKYASVLTTKPVSFRDLIFEASYDMVRDAFSELYTSGMSAINVWSRNRFHSDPQYRSHCLQRLGSIGITHGQARMMNQEHDGIIDVEYDASILLDHTTMTISGFIVTFNDITDRNTYRHQLEESEKKYRELFRLMPLFTMLIDTSGRTVEFNDSSMGEFAYDLEAGNLSYMDFIHEDDQHRAAKLFIDLYTEALIIKNNWIKTREINREECAERLRSIGIRKEPIRLINADAALVYETEFSARLWLGVTDLEIRGALLSAFDVSERNQYRLKLEDSERKYRELVEEKTRDIIFSLDTDGNFATINRNIRDKLGYQENELKGRSILDILYRDPLFKTELNRETFRENMDRVLSERTTDVRFKAICDHKFLGEPITLQFKLDPIIEDGIATGILGFASEISDDPLREYLIEESLSYEIDNKLTIADEISYRLTRNLTKYLPEGKVGLLRLGIREIIVNAIEHGNLGITWEEKTVAQDDRTYQKLLRERQHNRDTWKKRVHILYRLYRDHVEYHIADEGNGFDHRNFMTDRMDDINEQMLQHGRGLHITRSVFNEVNFNEKGNEVHLLSYFK